MNIQAYSPEEAKAFAEKWLPAWSGNNPELLASFYTDDAFYCDPGLPQGVRGKAGLLTYFKRLLAWNPAWVWTQTRSIPLQDGFANFWKAVIPKPEITLTCEGVCLVQLREGLIYRNEVFFDASKLKEHL